MVLLSCYCCLYLYGNLLSFQQHQLDFVLVYAADYATCVERSQFTVTLEGDWAWLVTDAA